MTVKLKNKLRRICATSLVLLALTAAEARADFYIAPSMGVGVSSQQIDTKALGGPGRYSAALPFGQVGRNYRTGLLDPIAAPAINPPMPEHSGPQGYL